MCDRMTGSSRKALDAVGGCEAMAGKAAAVAANADASDTELYADGKIARGPGGEVVGRYEGGRWRFGD